MKKIFALLLALCMVFGMVACGSEPTPDVVPNEVITDTAPETTTPQFNEVVVAETDDFVFTIKGTEVDEMWGTWGIKVHIENKTDKTLMFSWQDVSVNGYMIDPFWATEVAAGKKENTTICFYDTQFEENDITTVEDVEFRLWIYHTDEETWDMTDYLDEVFTITFN